MNTSHVPGVDLSCSILGRANGNLANLILDKINAFIFIIDTQTLKFVWSNRYMLNRLGYSFEELHEMSSDQSITVLHQDSQEKLLEIISSVRNLNFIPSANIPIRISTKEKESIWLLLDFNLFQIPPETEKRYIIAFGTVLHIDQLRKIVIDQNKPDQIYLPGSEMTLSCRQLTVLKLISKGLTDREIAVTLNISLNTAKTHRKNIIHKLGLKNTGTLIGFAIENGMV